MKTGEGETLVIGRCSGCGYMSTEEGARDLGVYVAWTITVDQARARGATWSCAHCGYQHGGANWSSNPNQKRYARKGRPRRASERVAVIRSLSGDGVGYRYFGESHGLREQGLDLSAAEGFKGTGSELSQKLGMTDVQLAGQLNISVADLTSTSYDISKD